MTRSEKISLSPCSTCTAPQALHFVLYFLCRELIAGKRVKLSVKSTKSSRTQKLKNQPTPQHLQGIALCLLKTQFAKKPKNPV